MNKESCPRRHAGNFIWQLLEEIRTGFIESKKSTVLPLCQQIVQKTAINLEYQRPI